MYLRINLNHTRPRLQRGRFKLAFITPLFEAPGRNLNNSFSPALQTQC